MSTLRIEGVGTNDPRAHLQACRKAAGVSLRALAKEIGVSHVHLAEIEKGRRTIGAKSLAALARALPGFAEAGTVEKPPRRARLSSPGLTALRGGASPIVPKPSQTNGASHGKNVVSDLPTSSHRTQLKPPDPNSSAREIAVEALLVLRERLRTAPPSELAKVAGAVSKASALLARLDGSLDITAVQICRSPPWKEALRIIERTLEPFPEAALALAKAFEDFAR